MRASLQQLIYHIRGSYWFLPSLMVVFAIALSQLSVWIDREIGAEWLSRFWFASMNQPDGARALLATVAGSMITVAGVTFSLTILAVSHATSHFGPRLLDNFMRDRGNQVTLGTFVATYLYCLLVLRVVRGASDSSNAINEEIFIPQLSILIALVLTIASVAELIYFIHHVPESIHISTVLQHLSRDMSTKMNELYPESVGEAFQDDNPESAAEPFFGSHSIRSPRSGYLQGIDDIALMSLATKNDTTIRLLRRPGDFIRESEIIAEVSFCSSWSDEMEQSTCNTFAFGFSRTPTQDIFFVLNEFVEVAARALSPGVNDPFTAMQCIDWLSEGISQLSRRHMPSSRRLDSEGTVRIITTDVSYEDFVHSMITQLAPYARSDQNTRQYFVDSLQKVIEISDNQPLNKLIDQQIIALQS